MHARALALYRVARTLNPGRLTAAARKREMRRAVCEAMRPERFLPRLGIDSGRPATCPSGAWMDWSADRRSGGNHAGWQLYAVAVRDLMQRGYPRATASAIAHESTTTNATTWAPSCTATVHAPWIAVPGDVDRQLAIRAAEDHGCDPLVVAAWSLWLRSVRVAAEPQIGRHARWLAAGVAHRQREREAQAARKRERVAAYLAGLEAGTGALYAESGARPECLRIDGEYVHEALHEAYGTMTLDRPATAAALAAMQRSHDACYHP